VPALACYEMTFTFTSQMNSINILCSVQFKWKFVTYKTLWMCTQQKQFLYLSLLFIILVYFPDQQMHNIYLLIIFYIS
jgi:hypothetical protein